MTLDNGTMLSARLLVGADGAHSALRRQADVPLTFWDYQHHALVATIRCEQPHDHIARQIFRPQDPGFFTAAGSQTVLYRLVAAAARGAAHVRGRAAAF